MGRGGRWAEWDVGWGMVINIWQGYVCVGKGEGEAGRGRREGSSSFNKFPSTLPKTSPTLSTTSSITTSKSMSTDLKPSQSVTTSQQSPAKTKTLLVDVGVDGSGGRVSAGVEMGVASHLFSWTNSSGERRGGMGENIVVFRCCSMAPFRIQGSFPPSQGSQTSQWESGGVSSTSNILRSKRPHNIHEMIVTRFCLGPSEYNF